MRLEDITLEVRNRALDRVGIINSQDIDLEAVVKHNDVGEWTVKIRRDHPIADSLIAPGSGIIVSVGGDVILSGPTTQPETTQDTTDPGGILTVTGVSDTVCLADALAYPDPSNGNATSQSTDADRRSGSAESLMHAYVNANIGPSAPANRRKANLVMGRDQGRGGNITKLAQFDPLFDIVKGIATASNMGFQVIQRGPSLVFETFSSADKTRQVRLSLANGSLQSGKLATAPPTITRAIVGAKGDEEANRIFDDASTDESVAAEREWGRRIEKFVDARSAEDSDEWQQAALEALAAGGFTKRNLQVIPSESDTMRFARDWNLGDQVSIEIEGMELPIIVTGAVLRVNSEGLVYGVTVGEREAFSENAGLIRKVTDLSHRMNQLETNYRPVEIPEPPEIPVIPKIEAGRDSPQSGTYTSFFSNPIYFDTDFSSPPTVVCTIQSNDPPVRWFTVQVETVNANYFQYKVTLQQGLSATYFGDEVNWVAVGT